MLYIYIYVQYMYTRNPSSSTSTFKQHSPRSLGGTVPGAHHSLAGREAEGDDDSVGAPVWCTAAVWSI